MSACPLGCPWTPHPDSDAWKVCETCGIETTTEGTK